jgi:hypothetical protein
MAPLKVSYAVSITSASSGADPSHQIELPKSNSSTEDKLA